VKRVLTTVDLGPVAELKPTVDSALAAINRAQPAA
jgi:hypothetical protein